MSSMIAGSYPDKTIVYFDIETTGLEKECDILQISAVCGDKMFDQYIFSTKKINPKATEIHEISITGDNMYYMNKPVKYSDRKTAMQMFSQYLSQFSGEIILAAHNGNKFDFPNLSRVMRSVNVEFPRNVKGFLDTLSVIKILCPGLKHYSLGNLVEENFKAHNALEDAKALQKLMLKIKKEKGIEKWFGVVNQCVGIDWITPGRSKASTRTFYGDPQNSFVEFEPWDVTRVVLEFQFKTQESDVMLLYAISSKRKNGKPFVINISIREKSLVLGTKESRNFDKVKTTNIIVNDNRYHHVKMEVKDFQINLILDQTHSVFEKEFDEVYIGNFSLYIGGVPVSKKFTDVKENSFIGCITQFRFQEINQSKSSYSPKVLQDTGTGIGCEDRCSSQATQQCLNRGRCLNRYVKTSCDCRGTGHTGNTCETQSQALHFDGSYMVWRPHMKLNDLNTEIFVRFKSYQSSGVILFIKTNHTKDSYMLLELKQNALTLRYKLKSANEEIITFGDNLINAILWKYVRIFRNQQSVSLVLDDGVSVRSYTKEMLTSYEPGDELTDIFIGGPKNLLQSQSKSSFKGCMQDIIISQVNLIEMHENLDDYGKVEKHDVAEGCSPSFNSSFDWSITHIPSIETSEHNSSFQITPKKEEITTPKYISEESSKTKTNNFVWIIVGTCVLLVVVTFILVLFIRHQFVKRQMERKQIRAHFLRQTDDETLPITTTTVNNHAKKQSCELQTFSPVRKAFYVSSSDVDILRKESLI